MGVSMRAVTRGVCVALCAFVFASIHPGAAKAQTHGDITTVGGIAGGLASCAASLFTWGFGIPLQVSIILHTGGAWALSREGSPSRYVPDMNTGVLAPVVAPTAPSVSSDDRIDAANIDAANALIKDIVQAVSVLRAMNTTLNRQFTAKSLGDSSNAALQKSYYTSTLIPALQAATTSADSNVHVVLTNFSDTTMTAAQAQSCVDDFTQNGFPAEELVIFEQLDASSCEMQKGLMLLSVPDLSAQASYSLTVDVLENVQLLMQSTVPYALGINLDPAEIVAVSDLCASTSVPLLDGWAVAAIVTLVVLTAAAILRSRGITRAA